MPSQDTSTTRRCSQSWVVRDGSSQKSHPIPVLNDFVKLQQRYLDTTQMRVSVVSLVNYQTILVRSIFFSSFCIPPLRCTFIGEVTTKVLLVWASKSLWLYNIRWAKYVVRSSRSSKDKKRKKSRRYGFDAGTPFALTRLRLTPLFRHFVDVVMEIWKNATASIQKT